MQNLDHPDSLNAGHLAFVASAEAGGVDSARVQVRAKKLLQLCLEAFDAHCSSPLLQQAADRSGTGSVWPKLLDLAIKLTGKHVNHENHQAWQSRA